MAVSLLILVLALFQQTPADLSELNSVINSYWDLLQARQKSQALEFVSIDSRDHFILRSAPVFRSWRLRGIEPADPGEYSVTVVVERLTSSGIFDWKVTESWSIEAGQWRVRIDDSRQALRNVWRSDSPAPVLEGILEVLPERLLIHFLSRVPEGTILIRNGLEEEVVVEDLQFDREKFELVEGARVVAPGQTAHLRLRYTGAEIAKDLESQVRLIWNVAGEAKELTIPITYNYLSPGARAILGLTPEAAQRLERGAKLAPKISRPKPPRP